MTTRSVHLILLGSCFFSSQSLDQFWLVEICTFYYCIIYIYDLDTSGSGSCFFSSFHPNAIIIDHGCRDHCKIAKLCKLTEFLTVVVVRPRIDPRMNHGLDRSGT